MCLLLDYYVIIYYKFNFLLFVVWMYYCMKIILSIGIYIVEDNLLKEFDFFEMLLYVYIEIDVNLRIGKGIWELLVGVIEYVLRVYSVK